MPERVRRSRGTGNSAHPPSRFSPQSISREPNRNLRQFIGRPSDASHNQSHAVKFSNDAHVCLRSIVPLAVSMPSCREASWSHGPFSWLPAACHRASLSSVLIAQMACGGDFVLEFGVDLVDAHICGGAGGEAAVGVERDPFGGEILQRHFDS